MGGWGSVVGRTGTLASGRSGLACSSTLISPVTLGKTHDLSELCLLESNVMVI